MERTPHVLCNTSLLFLFLTCVYLCVVEGTVTGFDILITRVDAGTLSKLRK